MNSTITRQEDGSIKLQITIPSAKVEEARKQALETIKKNANLPGFRKGKAPEKLVEDNINQQQVTEDILRKILPDSYIAAVQEHKLNPIMNPKIHVEKIEMGKDWEFSAITCELPAIDLGNYKAEVKKITAKSRIAIPGQEAKEPSFDEIMKAVLDNAKVTIPGILVEGEVDRLLSQTLNEIKSLGLTLDQYLQSAGKSPEKLREEYTAKATNDIKLEFTLQKIAEDEKITVEQPEIEEAVQKAKDPKERENLEANRYLLASIIRQQKTLDFLKSL